MFMQWVVRGAAVGLLFVGVSARAEFQFLNQSYPYQATSVIGFGDSLMDAGNVYAATGGTQPPSPPYAHTRSNGPTFLQDLGPMVGAPTPMPSLLGGTDFAWIGAEATKLSPAWYPVPSLEEQVGQFKVSGYVPKSTDLFVVWAGANDLFAGQTDPSVPALAVANQVKELASAGAKQILVLNLPPIQKTPDGLSQSPLLQAGIAQWVNGFNALLTNDIRTLEPALPAGVQLRGFDTYGFFEEMIANPAAFGFTNVTDPALTVGPPPSIVPNPDQYLFWDLDHPTQAGHLAIAQAIVPEPASLGLLVTTTALLLLRRRRAA